MKLRELGGVLAIDHEQAPSQRSDVSFSQTRSRPPWLAGALATVALSVVCLLPVAIPALEHLAAPWGAGDMTYFYFMGSTWDLVLHATTTSVNFPLGLDPNAFAGLDGLIYLVASPVTWVTGNPYVGLNLLLLLSFPVVAVMAYAAIRLTGLTGPLPVVLANAFTFIPFHFGRGIGHLPLGMMFGLASGVILALLIGSGRFNFWLQCMTGRARALRVLLVLGLVLVTAWTGLYFAFFGLILIAAATLWRISHGDSFRQWAAGLFTGLVLATTIALALVPVLIGMSNTPSAEDAALRDPMDSVTYAGNLAIAFVPQPYSIISKSYNDFVFSMFAGVPANEAHLMANFGTWVTSIAFVVFLVGLVTWNRAIAINAFKRVSPLATDSTRPIVSINYIAYLFVLVILLFVPWGLNYLIAYFGTAQVRAWNRLLPYLLLLLILGASTALAAWQWPRRRPVAFGIGAAVVIVTVVDMVLPWRNLYTYVPSDGQDRISSAYEYARRVNAAIPGRCGVLTLPFMAYPGAGPTGGMDDYDHFTIALTNPEKPISYGAFRGSTEALQFERLSSQPFKESIWDLRQLGYCGVHVDTRGYQDPQPVISDLRSQLGPPVAQVGNWVMFALSSPNQS